MAKKWKYLSFQLLLKHIIITDTQYMTIHYWNLSKSQKRWTYKPLWQHTVHLRVF